MTCLLSRNCDTILSSIESKPLKIVEDNKQAIRDVLSEINGRASAHTLTTYREIAAMVAEAERQLTALRLPKRLWQGARFLRQSGSRLPKAYRNRVITTAVLIERRSSAWYVVRLARVWLWPNTNPEESLYLTQTQREAAVQILEKLMKPVLPSAQDLSKSHLKTHAMLDQTSSSQTITQDMRAWLDHNTPGWASIHTMDGEAIVFDNDNHQFAFSLMWHRSRI